MHGAFSQLFHLCDLEEERSGEGEGEVLKQLFEQGDQFLWDRIDTSRHYAYNFQPGNCSFVN